MKALIGTLASFALVGAATAQTIELVPVDNSAAIAAAPGVFPADLQTFDLVLQNSDAGKIYTGAQILIELTDGTIFDLAPSLTPPNDNVGPFDPPFNELTTFDTFAAQGGDRVSTTTATLQVGAGPVNIDGTLSDAILNDTTWAQATNPAGGNDIFGPHDDFLLFRFNVEGNAVGTVQVLASVNAPGSADFTRASFNLPIPEPASAALLGLGGLAMLRRRAA